MKYINPKFRIESILFLSCKNPVHPVYFFSVFSLPSSLLSFLLLFRVFSWIKIPSTIFGAVRVNQKICSDEAQQHPGNHSGYLKKFVARYVCRMSGVKQNRPAQARNNRSDDSVARDERRHTKLPDLRVPLSTTQFSRLLRPFARNSRPTPAPLSNSTRFAWKKRHAISMLLSNSSSRAYFGGHLKNYDGLANLCSDTTRSATPSAQRCLCNSKLFSFAYLAIFRARSTAASVSGFNSSG